MFITLFHNNKVFTLLILILFFSCERNNDKNKNIEPIVIKYDEINPQDIKLNKLKGITVGKKFNEKDLKNIDGKVFLEFIGKVRTLDDFIKSKIIKKAKKTSTEALKINVLKDLTVTSIVYFKFNISKDEVDITFLAVENKYNVKLYIDDKEEPIYCLCDDGYYHSRNFEECLESRSECDLLKMNAQRVIYNKYYKEGIAFNDTTELSIYSVYYRSNNYRGEISSSHIKIELKDKSLNNKIDIEIKESVKKNNTKWEKERKRKIDEKINGL